MAIPFRLAKPYTISTASLRSGSEAGPNINYMFEEVYRVLGELNSVSTGSTGTAVSGLTFAQVSARVLHEL